MIDLIRLALATYLISFTIARLHGPYALAEKFRHAVYRWRGFRPGVDEDWTHRTRSSPAGDRYLGIEDDWVTAGISCSFCLSPYVAALLLLAPAPVLTWLAAAGGAAAIYKLSSR